MTKTPNADHSLTRSLLAASLVTLACLLCAPSGARAQTGQWETNGSNINNTNPGNVRVGGAGAAPSAVLHARGNLSSPLTGTVSVTQNSATVTGTGTAFTTELSVGDSVKIGTEVFTVSAIASATSLTLDSNYAGASAAGQTAFRDPNLFAVDTGDGANRLTVTRMGRVGIGTASPSSKLSIAETATLPNRGLGVAQYSTDATSALLNLTKLRGTPSAPAPVATGDSLGSIFANAYTGNYLATAGINFLVSGAVTSTAAPTDMVFRTGTTGYGNETMRLTSSGNLGVGTATPNQRLGVQGMLGLYPATWVSPTTRGLFAYHTGQAGHIYAFNYPGGTPDPLGLSAASIDFNTYVSGAPLTRLSITNGGNVGVGTTTPAHKLDVAGSLNVSGGLCIDGACKASWSEVGGGSQWATSGSNISYSAGNVGVGTGAAAPAAKLEVVGPATGLGPTIRAGGGGDLVLAAGGSVFFDGNYSYASGSFIRPVAANTQSFFTSGLERVRIESGGDVGVGTTAPASRLHVVGANGPANNTAAPAPVAFQVIGGTGGNGSWGASPGGAGGAISLLGGTGGVPVAGSSSAKGGTGGAVNLTGGVGGPDIFNVGGGAGGNVVLNGGQGVDNADGNVVLANLRGNVGVGTAAPTVKLDVAGQVRSSSGGFVFPDGSVQTTASGGGAGTITAVNAGAGLSGGGSGGSVTLTNSDRGSAQNIFKNVANAAGAVQFSAASNNDALRIEGTGGTSVVFDAATRKVTINSAAAGAASGWTDGGGTVTLSTATDRVGIGAAPSATDKLHVQGDVKVTGTLRGGVIEAHYQDVAEWVPSAQALAAGTVVVLDVERTNHVVASSSAYDTRVAGVVSARPGLVLGEGGAGKLMVATTGRVKVKVDATRGAIRVGDLLVTSGVEGLAMKSTPVDLAGTPIHRPGTIIGKALEPLEKGTGEILVLLSMQ